MPDDIRKGLTDGIIATADGMMIGMQKINHFLLLILFIIYLIAEGDGKGFQIIVTWLGAGTLDFREVDYTRPSVIVVGNEVEGVSPALLPLATHRIKIPMVGMVRSLNVSVATAVILYEAFRQREVRGFYETPQFKPQEVEEILYQWAYENIIRGRSSRSSK